MKKKGFTLIELLAVIVILAVIALIATPIIMNVINDSKKGAAKDAMYGYVKAVELSGTNIITATTDAPTGDYVTKDGNIYNISKKILDVNFKGMKPADNGSITLNHGTVVRAKLAFDGIKVSYDGEKAEIKVEYQPGDIIYYNPETNQKCNNSEINTDAFAKTGCLKWNVITTDDKANKTSIDVMLDHNTTQSVVWNSSGSNTDGMKEAKTALTNDVTTWHTNIKSTARLITGQEIADVTENAGWTAAGEYISLLKQSWLYQNLSKENTDTQSSSYWTSTKSMANSQNVWYVAFDGKLYGGARADFTGLIGIRPVITIPKSIIA